CLVHRSSMDRNLFCPSWHTSFRALSRLWRLQVHRGGRCIRRAILRALHLDSDELGLPQRLFGRSAGCACGKWLNLHGRTRNRKNGTSAAILDKRCLLANVLSLSALPASGGCRITSMKRHAAKLSRCETA